jgi:phenylacetate-CoA ligase
MKLAFSRKNAWEQLPAPLKRGVGVLLGAVPPAVLLGGRFRSHLRFVEAAQWWPVERVREYQLAELQRLCQLAWDRTAYYRRTFVAAGFDPRDLRGVEDLRRLPLIDRDTLREHLDEMCAVSPEARTVDYTTTGGTSGAPLRFYIGADRSSVEYAYLVSSWQRAGFRLGTALAAFRGRAVAPDPNGFRHAYDPLLRQHYYSNFHMNDETMGRYLDHLEGIGPCFLHVYASSATALSRFIQRSGRRSPSNVQGLIAESEIVYPEQRELVEKVFGRRLFSCYGLTEKVVVASECERSTRYHVWPTYGFFELLDDRGEPVTTPGQRGEIVGTGFINRVVPFIRYRTGDYATWVGEHCDECGRHHPLIEDIRGHRVQETLVARDGHLITWTALNVHDDTFDRVLRFQFFQDTPGRARLRVVPAPGFGPADRQRIERGLELKLDGQLELSFELVESIPLSRSGKVIYVDQRIPGATAGGQGEH